MTTERKSDESLQGDAKPSRVKKRDGIRLEEPNH